MAAKRSSKSSRRRRPLRSTPKPPPTTAKSKEGLVSPEDVLLERTRGTPGRGDGPGGEKWRVEAAGLRAGHVYINVIDEPPLGTHASIQIFLNKKSQGRQIGRVAYRAACEKSQHDTIYAHMSRSNHASRRAAEEAGFVDVTPTGHTQLIMRRSRQL